MISRRTAIAATAAGVCGYSAFATKRRPRLERARVAVLKASSYSADFEQIITRGLKACGIDVTGKTVLVKPNLVEYVAGSVVHTHAAVLAGCIAALESLGAHVIVGEGPGHRRDTLDMARAAGYGDVLPNVESRFIDLNLDDPRAIAALGGAPLYVAETAAAADVIVSLAKMKTHHWAGATLSMKNLFGIVSGAVYGWPKNHLHYLGIDSSVAALYNSFPKVIGIVDGVIAMEGNGPIQGRAIHSGVVVIGSDTAAVDATCCELMGIDSARIGYLHAADGKRVNLDAIDQRGEAVPPLAQRFELPPRMSHLRLAT